MYKIASAVALTLLFITVARQTEEPKSEKIDFVTYAEQMSDSNDSKLLDLHSETILYAAACCKVCKKGKACGDSCISKDYVCHKPPGCACNAN
jgi:hypothetical protein